jgi:hypothetical protein
VRQSTLRPYRGNLKGCAFSKPTPTRREEKRPNQRRMRSRSASPKATAMVRNRLESSLPATARGHPPSAQTQSRKRPPTSSETHHDYTHVWPSFSKPTLFGARPSFHAQELRSKVREALGAAAQYADRNFGFGGRHLSPRRDEREQCCGQRSKAGRVGCADSSRSADDGSAPSD